MASIPMDRRPKGKYHPPPGDWTHRIYPGGSVRSVAGGIQAWRMTRAGLCILSVVMASNLMSSSRGQHEVSGGALDLAILTLREGDSLAPKENPPASPWRTDPPGYRCSPAAGWEWRRSHDEAAGQRHNPNLPAGACRSALTSCFFAFLPSWSFSAFLFLLHGSLSAWILTLALARSTASSTTAPSWPPPGSALGRRAVSSASHHQRY